MESSTVRLTALEGEPLRDDRLRDLVVATAHAIAERTGVALTAIDPSPDGVQVTISAGRLAALGFVAELRRVTEAWHRGRTGRSLWGEPAQD
jgi:hypothetical protein